MDIDIVVLWVDGSDPEWQIEKAKYSGHKLDDTNSVNRFRDWGLMPYWFRAVENYLPWVRTIHFVTCGQVPSFLKLDHPKLHFVTHREFMPEDCLPTFNASAIEMNIHRIEGLAEHFLYMNDDTFIGRPLKPEAFFKNGLPCVNGSEQIIPPTDFTETARHMAINDVGVINNHFKKKMQLRKNRGKYIHPCYGLRDNIKTLAVRIAYPNYFVGFKNKHAVSPYLKQTFEEIWAAEPDLLMNTSRNKFRTKSDVNQWLALWWQVASGKFTPSEVDNVTYLVVKVLIDEICDTIVNQKHDLFCLQDPDWEVDFNLLSARLRDAFEVILPDKSTFEK